MAASVTVAALRSRPRQAVLVAALAAVVTAAGALGPLYARAVEQSVLRHVMRESRPAASLVVTDESARLPARADLVALLQDDLPAELAAPVAGADAPVQVLGRGARLTARDDVCAHVHVVVGRCAASADEVLLSRRTSTSLGAPVGSALAVQSDAVSATVSVVGLYDGIDPAATYWAGRATSTSDAAGGQVLDDLLTPWSTLAAAPWPRLQSHLDALVRPDRVDLRRVDGLRARLVLLAQHAEDAGAYATTTIPARLASADGQRRQSGRVILLLALQLALLGLVVLTFVGAAVTEQRRPEIALARLRGLGTGGAAGMLLREVAVLLALGAAAGLALAYAIADLAKALWLEPGVQLELRPSVTLAVLASFAAGLLGVLAAAAPTVRQPITALLRRVPPRASALRVGLAEGAVGAAAAAGVVTLLSGQRGVVALLAPGLLALAGGLLLSQLVVPLAGPLARRALRHGRLPTGLAALQIARRPALRRLIAIVTVSVALLVFAVDAWSVGARNRTTRAQVDAGAPVVLTVDATDPQQLRTAVLAVDPTGTFATPVVDARSATASGPRTLAVEPAAFRRIAQWGGRRPKPAAFRSLTEPTVPAVGLPGVATSVTIDATYRMTLVPRPPRFFGDLQPISLAMELQQPSGLVTEVPLGRLRPGSASYSSAVRCADCQLAGFTVLRTFGDSYPVSLSLAITAVRVNGKVIDLGPATSEAWQVQPSQSLPTTATVRPGPPLTITDPSSFESTHVLRGDVPAVTPALVAGDVAPPFQTTTQVTTSLAVAPDLNGSDHVYAVAQRIPLVPRAGARTVLTTITALQRTEPGLRGQTTYDVWLAADDRARETAVRAKLADHGLHVIGRDSTALHAQAFTSEGPTLALRLAVVAGLAALLLAAAVLVVGVATSGTTRARDLAGLRIVGVPLATLRRAAVLEHLVVAVLGVAAGTVLGLAAAQAALPDLPLFADPSGLVPPILRPAWLATAATAVGCLLLLSAVSVLVGRALAGSAAPAHLRETA